jgi:hypothetical protein
MTTTLRPELSGKNKYWIERHRYYELKHFCLQYPIWKKAYAAVDGLSKRPPDSAICPKTNVVSDPTAKSAAARSFYFERMQMVEQTAMATDPDLAGYILKAVTEGVSYDHLNAQMEVPCCKDIYYELYRRFFWLLNKERQ